MFGRRTPLTMKERFKMAIGWIEHDNPLLDRPAYATVWIYEWNDDHKWYESTGSDLVMNGLPWTIEK